MKYKNLFVVLIPVTLFLLGCELSGPVSSSANEAPQAERRTQILQTAEKLGLNPETIDMEASLKSPSGAIIGKGLIVTDREIAIARRHWPEIWRPGELAKNAYDQSPPTDQDQCFGLEIGPTWHDYCQCLYDPTECPDVEDTLPCSSDEQCDSGGSEDDTSSGSGDDTSSDSGSDDKLDILMDHGLRVGYDSYDENTAWANPVTFTEAVGSDIHEAIQIDTYLHITGEDFIILSDSSYTSNKFLDDGGWKYDTKRAYFSNYYIRQGAYNIRVIYRTVHDLQYRWRKGLVNFNQADRVYMLDV